MRSRYSDIEEPVVARRPVWDRFRSALSSMGLIALIWFTMLGGCPGDMELRSGSQDPQPGPPWDSDNDGISTAVEADPANEFHRFDTTMADINPSLALGLPEFGTLLGGINLPDSVVGGGYKHYVSIDPVNFDDWGTLALIYGIEATGRGWAGDFRTPSSQILDLSKMEGGSWKPDHDWHQNGLDLDVRYMHDDREELPLNICLFPSNYDITATIDLLNTFVDSAAVKLVIVSKQCSDIVGPIVIQDSTTEHNNHFHLQINDPDGTAN